MIKGFAILAPQYTPVVYFSKRYPEIIIRASYPLDPPDEIVRFIGGKLDRMHDYYIGSCVGVTHAIRSVMAKSDPYNTGATINAINNVLDEHRADIACFAWTIKLPDQLSIFSRDEREGLDEQLYHAEVVRETAVEAQANG